MRHAANRRDVFLIGLIQEYMKLYNVSDEKIAAALGMGKTTWYRRKANPGDFTLDELGLVCKRLQIPMEELKARLW